MQYAHVGMHKKKHWRKGGNRIYAGKDKDFG